MAILPHITAVIKRITKVKLKKKLLSRVGKSVFWFSLGSILGFFFFISFLYIYYQKAHTDRVYEGVIVNGVTFGGKTKDDVKHYFDEKNQKIEQTTVTLTTPLAIATVSAREIDFGYDSDLLANQAVSIGRSDDKLSNMSLITQAYFQNILLPPAYHYSGQKLNKIIIGLKNKTDIQPVDPLFNFVNNKVVTFREGSDGQTIDAEPLNQEVLSQFRTSLQNGKGKAITYAVPIIKIPSAVTEDKAKTLGIVEKVGEGTSLFQGSIENRAYNINLAASKLNGILIKPDEVFSFDKAIGDISVFSGYRQAYVISGGKTVLGDGGGVCQVSTTLFRAALQAGLPIVERNAHAYRVGYYEQDSGPGIDAAIYTPSVDLKFKNDTKNSLLIQSYVDLDSSRITFSLYGTKDGRQVELGIPVVSSVAPAPDPLNQDDPTLPKGVVKQVDFAAAGAKVYFTRTVTRDRKTLISETFTSNYRPWQAVYMHGTKE